MRIVIVEDEVKIREGMAHLIESQTKHIVLEKAADGEEGLKAILRYKPDLVIADIRMPKMDGLEMIHELNERKVPVHVIILSGYSEFEYAKRAIQYGVDDYLLKPLTAEDVTSVLDKIEAQIEVEQLTKGTPEVHIGNLVCLSNSEEERIYEILNQVCHLPWEGCYELLEAYIGSADAEYRKKLEETIEELKEKYLKLTIHYVYIGHLQKVYILVWADGNKEEMESFLAALYRKMIYVYKNKIEKARWTKKSFDSLKMLKTTMNLLDQRIAAALNIECRDWITDEMISAKGKAKIETPTAIYTKIRNAIYSDDGKKLKAAIEEFVQYIEQGDFLADDIKRTFMKTHFLIIDTLQDINKSVYDYLIKNDYQKKIENAITWEELKNSLQDVVDRITNSCVNREGISNYVIKKAIAYIREHYQEGLTQEELSRKLEITPEYLSTLFKRELGINFTTFLKQFRLSHAKRLLKGSDMKIYEVAEAVGYNDSKYFQRVFKEEYGVSPGEYRALH